MSHLYERRDHRYIKILPRRQSEVQVRRRDVQPFSEGGRPFQSLRDMSPRRRGSDHAFGMGATRQSAHVRQTDPFTEIAAPCLRHSFGCGLEAHVLFRAAQTYEG